MGALLLRVTTEAMQWPAMVSASLQGNLAQNASSGPTSTFEFCGNSSTINGVNSTYPTKSRVSLEVTSYALSLSSCVVMLTILLLTKFTGHCRRNYSLQASEHIISIMGFIAGQSLTFFAGASVDFHAVNFTRPACIVQGAFYQFCSCGVLLEIAAMAFMTQCAISSQVSLEELYPQHRRKVFAVVFGTAAVLTMIPVAVDVGSGGSVGIFDRSMTDTTCWIENCTGAFVIFAIFLYGAVAIYSAVICVKVFLVFMHILRHSRTVEVRTRHSYHCVNVSQIEATAFLTLLRTCACALNVLRRRVQWPSLL